MIRSNTEGWIWVLAARQVCAVSCAALWRLRRNRIQKTFGREKIWAPKLGAKLGAKNLSRGKRRKVKKEGGPSRNRPPAVRCLLQLIAAYCSLLRKDRFKGSQQAPRSDKNVLMIIIIAME